MLYDYLTSGTHGRGQRMFFSPSWRFVRPSLQLSLNVFYLWVSVPLVWPSVNEMHAFALCFEAMSICTVKPLHFMVDLDNDMPNS